MTTGCFLEYKGVSYYIGTKVKLKKKNGKIVTTTFLGHRQYEGVSQQDFYSIYPPEHYIVEIVEPVYYQDPAEYTGRRKRKGGGSIEDSFHIWILYIVVMVVGAIFKDKWMIWSMATFIFFCWKNL